MQRERFQSAGRDWENIGPVDDGRCETCGVASGYGGDWIRSRPEGDDNSVWRIDSEPCANKRGF